MNTIGCLRILPLLSALMQACDSPIKGVAHSPDGGLDVVVNDTPVVTTTDAPDRTSETSGDRDASTDGGDRDAGAAVDCGPEPPAGAAPTQHVRSTSPATLAGT